MRRQRGNHCSGVGMPSFNIFPCTRYCGVSSTYSHFAVTIPRKPVRTSSTSEFNCISVMFYFLSPPAFSVGRVSGENVMRSVIAIVRRPGPCAERAMPWFWPYGMECKGSAYSPALFRRPRKIRQCGRPATIGPGIRAGIQSESEAQCRASLDNTILDRTVREPESSSEWLVFPIRHSCHNERRRSYPGVPRPI